MIGLNLPLDIPWKRICTSDDMMVRNPGDWSSPRWRSSIAVFEYQPAPESQVYENMTVSYLKVVSSLTGYQPDPQEVGLKDRRANAAISDARAFEQYEMAASRYYGCYGAILEVVVTPGPGSGNSADIPFSKFPYFADFEPKKRELYELVSETGEMMSRSLESVNVRKGLTTSESREVLDVFGGANLEVTTPEGVKGGAGVQGQWGSTDMTQGQREDIRTTDTAKESRVSLHGSAA